MTEKLIKEDLKITDERKLYELKEGTWLEYEYTIFDKKKCYIYNGLISFLKKKKRLITIFQDMLTQKHIKRNTEYYNLIK